MSPLPTTITTLDGWCWIKSNSDAHGDVQYAQKYCCSNGINRKHLHEIVPERFTQLVNMETVCRNEISPSAKIFFFLNRLSSFSNLLLVWHALIYFQLLGFLIAEEPILKYSQLSYTEFTLHHLGMFCIILIFLLSALCQVRVNLIFIVFFYIYFLVL